MRLEITRKADLAVRAMVILGRVEDVSAGEGRLKAADLAVELDATTGFVPQIVGPLVREGWVRSEPGPTGGYRLAVPLGQVNVLEVVEALDGPTEQGRCVVAGRRCGDEPLCALHSAWAEARAQLLDTLRGTSLAQIAAREQPEPSAVAVTSGPGGSPVTDQPPRTLVGRTTK